jgi:hypothetical protein
MRTKIIILLFLIAGNYAFAQRFQLRPEAAELYTLQDIAMRSRFLNSDSLIEKHEAFFAHPLFCETAFGYEYINFAEILLTRGEFEVAKKYLLIAAKSPYMNTSDMLEHFFNRRERVWPDTVYVIPKTPENLKFKETTLEKILEIENSRVIDPRIFAIFDEIREMIRKDQAARRAWDRTDKLIEWDSVAKVDSANIYRIKELIVENPDIDILRFNRGANSRWKRDGDLWLIFWHVRAAPYAYEAWSSFFEPYLRKRVEDGKGLDYTYWYDALCFGRREDSHFGIIPASNTPTFRYPFDNRDEVNKNRAEVGLLPLGR